MNKKTILIIVGIIVVLVGGGVYRFTKSSLSGQQNQNPTSYSNSAYGLTFTYPEKYKAQDRDAGTAEKPVHEIKLITKEDFDRIQKGTMVSQGPTSILFTIYPSNGISLDEWIANSKDSHFETSTAFATTSIDGAFAVAYSWNGTYRTNSVVFSHKNNIVMVSMTYTSFEDQIWKDFTSVLKSIKLN